MASPGLLIAYDSSGSTRNQALYHKQTQQILADLGDRARDAVILQWYDRGWVITREELDRLNRDLRGDGGTEPVHIAEHICRTEFSGDLVIITDGQVNSRDIDMADARLRGRSFNSVTAHLIHTGGAVNLSVSCPFTRTSPHIVKEYRERTTYDNFERPLVYSPTIQPWERYATRSEARKELVATTVASVTAEDIAAVAIIGRVGTAEEYLAAADAIERAVVARTMGTSGDPALRDAILAMKNRLIAAEAAALGQSESSVALYEALERGDTAAAVSCATKMTREYYGDDADVDGHSWSARINRLVSLCEGALRGVFDLSGIGNAIKTDRARRAGLVDAAPTAAVPLTEDSGVVGAEETFTCPITMDDETDVVVLAVSEGSAVLAGLDKEIVDSVIDCPLNALGYPEVVARLKGKIDHPISLRAYKEAADAGMPIETGPFTRRTVHGGICLGANAEHAAATSWTLARVISGGKRLGNMDLWFAVLWLLVERGEIPYLSELAPKFRAHMRYRLQNHTTFMGMTGLPELPTTRVRLAAAAWYVFASGALELPTRRQAIRAHLFHAEALAELVRLTGYALPAGAEKYAARLRGVARALTSVKKNAHAFHDRVAALTQACVHVDLGRVGAAVRERESRCGKWIPVDGPAGPEQIAAVMAEFAAAGFGGLDADDLRLASRLVHPSKSLADIEVPFAVLKRFGDPPAEDLPVTEWEYGLGAHPSVPVKICVATCRPYYAPRPAATWRDLCLETHGLPAEKTISLNEQFGNFVTRYGAYPNRDEFLVFLQNRFLVHGRRRTLPAPVGQFVDDVFADYTEIVATVPADEFARRWEASRPIAVRMSIENGPC